MQSGSSLYKAQYKPSELFDKEKRSNSWKVFTFTSSLLFKEHFQFGWTFTSDAYMFLL